MCSLLCINVRSVAASQITFTNFLVILRHLLRLLAIYFTAKETKKADFLKFHYFCNLGTARGGYINLLH